MLRSRQVPAVINGNKRAMGLRIKRGLSELGNLDAKKKGAESSGEPKKKRRVEKKEDDAPSLVPNTPQLPTGVCPHVFDRDWEDWKEAKRCIFGSSGQDLTEKNYQRFFELSAVWRARTREPYRLVPPAVLATELLVYALTVDDGKFPEQLVAQMYSSCLARLVHVTTGSFNRGEGLNTYRKRAREIGLPEEVIEVRQRTAHGVLPSLTELRWVASMTLEYLFDTYWMPQEKAILSSSSPSTSLRRKGEKVGVVSGGKANATAASLNPSEAAERVASESSGPSSSSPSCSLEELQRFVAQLDGEGGRQETEKIVPSAPESLADEATEAKTQAVELLAGWEIM